ncbi:MAG TPA: ABC transporter permease [Ktedonobacteraceae bacterium]|nr:ABC transporter permease [Ktedonobacteraceae bacterium]
MNVNMTLLIVSNEIYKRLRILWTYRMNILTQVLTVGFIFIGASYFIENGQLNPAPLASVLLGYLLWFYARIVIMSSSEDLMREMQAGTLEQIYMSPVSASLLLFSRLLALLFSTTIIVMVPMTIMALLLKIQIPVRWEGILALAITLLGLFGFTLALSGIALVFKQIGALADLVQNALLFLTGSLLPVSRFPFWLTLIAQTLPITQGIIVLRAITLQGHSLLQVWSDGSLFWLCVNSGCYLMLGLMVFKWGERVAKMRGSIGHY